MVIAPPEMATLIRTSVLRLVDERAQASKNVPTAAFQLRRRLENLKRVNGDHITLAFGGEGESRGSSSVSSL